MTQKTSYMVILGAQKRQSCSRRRGPAPLTILHSSLAMQRLQLALCLAVLAYGVSGDEYTTLPAHWLLFVLMPALRQAMA